MSFKIKGLDDINRSFDKLANNAKSISGTNKYSFNEIFTADFMKSNTKFDSIEAFLESSPEHITTQEEFEAANETVLDHFVSANSNFDTWQDMIGEATTSMIASRIGL
ncbi:hypothetical protein [Streptococcus hyovaginalis]|uniref:hypothetical protein n=1 Tax=Streptococcus hyovaginalis TaxID=149015 RepID=UPI00147962AC|nr:hypothetical protein [Streptococcus hyovaginalis]